MVVPAAAVSPTAAKINTAIPVTLNGTFASGVPGTFSGTFNLQNFSAQNGQLVANGALTGAVTQTVNGVTSTVGNLSNFPVQLPVSSTSAANSCQILHLMIGPINLNLLGLMVNTNQIVLDITAQSGSGNLLGNLLCGVAHLLDSNAPAGSVANALNHILGL